MPKRGSDRTVRKIVFGTLGVLLLLMVLLGIVGFIFVNNARQPVDSNSQETVEVIIPEGSSRTDITSILEEEGVINNAFVFDTYLRFNNEEGFHAGYYEMSPAMSMEEIADYLQEGGEPIPEATDFQTVTLPEGITIEDISEYVADATDYTAEEFMEVVTDQAFIDQQVERYPELLTAVAQEPEVIYTLEGYLYPATYEFTEETSLEELIEMMINRMDEAVRPHYADIEASPYDVNEILSLASLIEGEGVTEEDRALISGVFHNRLNIGMPIQSDVSILYAQGEHIEYVTFDDLEIASPYNLYQNPGLPPGPLNSPSESSINAAVNPADTDYLYFVADIHTGEIFYSEDYETHLELVEEHVNS